MEATIASLHQIETELKKRWEYPYHWHKKQNNAADKLTYFIYDFLYFEDLIGAIQKNFAQREDYEALKDYTLNRWYNYWSSVAVERVLTSCEGIEAHPNEKHHSIDFYLNGVPFDHKSTVFPYTYPESQTFAEQNPIALIRWLYDSQSAEQRWHVGNRLFLVFYDAQGFHWKLKADITQITEVLKTYAANFTIAQLKQVALIDTLVWSDVIWVKA